MKLIQSWKRWHLYYLLIFAVAYMVVSLLYYTYFVTFHMEFQSLSTKIFVAITSPLSPLEDLSNIYTSTVQGLSLNLVFLLFVILLSEIIYSWSKNIKKYLRLPENIFVGIAASYLTALIFWYLSGFPSSGTSIIGLNLLTFSILCIILDLPLRITNLKNNLLNENKKVVLYHSLILILYVLAFILIYALYASYGYRLTHLIGGVIGLVIFISLLIIRAHKQKKMTLRPVKLCL